jgi:hypothetical protein
LGLLPVHLAPANFDTKGLESRFGQQSNCHVFRAIGNVQVDADTFEKIVAGPLKWLQFPGQLMAGNSETVDHTLAPALSERKA